MINNIVLIDNIDNKIIDNIIIDIKDNILLSNIYYRLKKIKNNIDNNNIYIIKKGRRCLKH